MSCALPHKKWLAATALPAGKTLYFFTVLLTGSSSIFLHQGAFCHCPFLLDLFIIQYIILSNKWGAVQIRHPLISTYYHICTAINSSIISKRSLLKFGFTTCMKGLFFKVFLCGIYYDLTRTSHTTTNYKDFWIYNASD